MAVNVKAVEAVAEHTGGEGAEQTIHGFAVGIRFGQQKATVDRKISLRHQGSDNYILRKPYGYRLVALADKVEVATGAQRVAQRAFEDEAVVIGERGDQRDICIGRSHQQRGIF